jgi:HNH endonuclease
MNSNSDPNRAGPRRMPGHHLVHWARGGTTDLDNLVLLCHRHHWMVHEGGWQLVKREDGSLLAVAPMADYRFSPSARSRSA